MTRRRRRRLRLAMWACVACSAALGGVWVASGWYEALLSYCSTKGIYWAGARAGSLFLGWDPPGRIPWAVPGFQFLTGGIAQPSWRGEWHFHVHSIFGLASIPFWFLSLFPVAAGFLCFRLSRRLVPGLCPRCGYDLAGVPAGVCPECGAAAKPDPTP